MTAPRAPTSRPVPLAWIALAAVLQLAFLLWAARGAIPQAETCEVCDTSYYLASAAGFARDGMAFANPYDGYRSYFVPMVFAAVQAAAGLFGADGPVPRQAYGMTALFWALSLAAMLAMRGRVPRAVFATAAIATLLNPFLLVYVPYAMQEGVLMALCLPLMFLWCGGRAWPPAARASFMVLAAVLAYAIRASLLYWLLAALAYAAWLLWRARRTGGLAGWRWPAAGVLAATLALLGPQVYHAKQKFDSFNPYPSTTLISQQLAWGITLLKFGTVEDHGHWRGLTHFSPFVAEPEEDKTARFYLDNPGRALVLGLAHAWAGFHADQLRPYWKLERARPLTPWLLLSSAIVFLGLARLADQAAARRFDAEDGVALLTVGLCAASLVLVAAETRFGIVGFLFLSIQAARWLGSPPGRPQWAILAPGLLLYLAVSFLYNALLLHSADIRL